MNRYRFDKEEHVHFLDETPLMGTSTVCKIIGKGEALSWFASAEACKMLGWSKSKVWIDGKYSPIPFKERAPKATAMLRKLRTMKTKEYLGLLDEAYKSHDRVKREAAKVGTDRHALLETYVKHCMAEHGGAPYKDLNEPIQNFIDWAQVNIRKFLWSEIHGFSEALWTGGIADVGWEDMEGRVVAGDFKSSKEAYFDQFVQVAGYHTMLAENGGYTADGDKIFTLEREPEAYCIVPFGAPQFQPAVLHEIAGMKEAFKAAVNLTKLKNQLFKET